MKRIVGAVAAAVMAAALLSGCGGDDNKSSSPSETSSVGQTTGSSPSDSPSTSDSGDNGGGDTGSYCDDLVAAKATVQSLGGSSLNQANFDKLVEVLHNIADEAPADVADDWNTLGDTLDSISQALKDAGITFDDLDKLGQPGGPTLDPTKLQALTTALQGMNGNDITAASQAIQAEVTKDCGFNLGIGS